MDPETKSLTDCLYFMTSRCTKGDACEYRHSVEAKRNPNPCNYWVRGSCTNPFCKFRHPAGLGRAASGTGHPSKHPSASSADPSTTSCWFYLNGGCNKGAACPFVHDPANLPRGFDPKDGTKLNGDAIQKALSSALEPEDTESSKGKSSIFSRLGSKQSSSAAAPAAKKLGGLNQRELLKAQSDDGPAPDFGVKPLTNLVDSPSGQAEQKTEEPAQPTKPKTSSKNIDGALNQMFSRALAGAGATKKRQRSEEAEADSVADTASSDAKRQKVEEPAPKPAPAPAPKAAAPKVPAPAPAPAKPAPVAVTAPAVEDEDDELAGLDDGELGDMEGEVPDDIQLD